MSGILLMVIAAVVAFALTSANGDGGLIKGISDGADSSAQAAPVYNFDGTPYTKLVSAKGTNGEIFLPSDIAGIYFTADLAGNVKFYDYANGDFAASTLPVKQVKTNLAATYESIPVTVNYIEKDGKKISCNSPGYRFKVFVWTVLRPVRYYIMRIIKIFRRKNG